MSTACHPLLCPGITFFRGGAKAFASRGPAFRAAEEQEAVVNERAEEPAAKTQSGANLAQDAGKYKPNLIKRCKLPEKKESPKHLRKCGSISATRRRLTLRQGAVWDGFNFLFTQTSGTAAWLG